jgi:hypothetical protein
MILIDGVPRQIFLTVLLGPGHRLLPLKFVLIISAHDLLQYELVNECVPIYAISGGLK